jgi:hypothetical protein
MSILSKKYEVYKINEYEEANNAYIEDKKEKYCLDKLLKLLETDNGYHFRIHKKERYIFFGDLDNYKNGIEKFIKLLSVFLESNYGLNFTKEEFKYTQNDKNEGSYHYSIPKWNLTTEKLKEIITKFKKNNEEEFMYLKDKKEKSSIDTSIYSEHWFRCPNQKKGIKSDNTKHKIIEGNMSDFIINYIDEKSEDIDNIIEVKDKKKELNNSKKVINNTTENDNNNKIMEYDDKKQKKTEFVLSATMSSPILLKKIMDCLKQKRSEEYEYWIKIGMALLNTIDDEKIAFELFDYFSKKGKNYEGTEKTEKKFNTFIKKQNYEGHTVATIYFYALEDNKLKFIEIMNKNTFDLEQWDIAKYAYSFAGKKFIYIKENEVYKLYCYDGKIWVKDDIIMKHFLCNELYEFLKMVLVELYFEHHTFNRMKNQIKKLKNVDFQNNVIESYKTVGTNNDIKYDDKWWLIGFNNMVYDLKEATMREYKYDDYVSITVGYDWREPTENELKTMNMLINQIMPIDSERKLYQQILCTSLDGRCLEKFIIFNGSGGNGKGMINDILLRALGNYAMISNNAILFETNKSGSNPEKANIHKKRLVIFREPSEKNKFENSVVKELTGGGTFSARGHHESTTKKELNLTMIVECNNRPLFSEEPKQSEIRRMIDLFFATSYTEDKSMVDEKKNIYLANTYYKQNEFQEQHKYALLKILMDEHKNYLSSGSVFNIPDSVKNRTKIYLEMSCNIVSWFKDTYDLTNKKSDILKIKDIYSDFTSSIYYSNISKNERKKYNKAYFKEYIETNIFFKPYYKDKTHNDRSVIQQWIKKDDDVD